MLRQAIGRRACWIGPLLVILLTGVFYWKLAFTSQYVWFDHPDMVNLELPRLQYQAWQIHHRHFPLWDPNIWCGQPLIGQTQPGPLYPLNLLFLLLPMEEGYLRPQFLNGYYVFLHMLAALFAYALARELRMGRAASVMCGCLFSFSGFMGTVPWLDVMNGGITTPLAALYLIRAIRGERRVASAALCGLFLGVAWLSGHHELPLLVTLAVMAAWAIAVWKDRRLLGPAALSLVIFALVSAAQMWPTMEFGRLSRRWMGTEIPAGWKDTVPYRIHTIYSMPPRGLAESVLPGLDTYGDTAPFAGAVAIGLALLAVAARWSDRKVRWMAALTLTAAVYALGAFTPLQGFLYAVVPNLDKARLPVRALHLFNLGLAALAAFGFDVLLRKESETWSRRVARALGIYALVVLTALAAGLVWCQPGSNRMWISGFCAAAGWAVMTAYRQKMALAGMVTVALFGLVLTELTGLVSPLMTYSGEGGKDLRFAGNLTRFHDIGRFLKRQPEYTRVVVNDTDVPINLGDQEGFEMHQGYVAGVPENLFRMELHLPRVQQLIGITHWVAKEPARPKFEDVFTGSSGVKVFRVPEAMPRAWMVHRVESVAGFDQLNPRLADPGLDFHNTAVTIGPAPALETCQGPDSVKILRKGPDRVTVAVDAQCRGLLVVGDGYFPGWRVKIDGQPGTVLPVYGMLRGVVVTGGKHTVDMIYRPASVSGGLALSLLGVALSLWLWRRQRP